MSKSEPSAKAIREAFGDTVKLLRKDRGIPQEELAHMAHVDRGYMGGLERGRHTPSLKTLLRVAAALHVSGTHFMREFERRLKHPLALLILLWAGKFATPDRMTLA